MWRSKDDGRTQNSERSGTPFVCLATHVAVVGLFLVDACLRVSSIVHATAELRVGLVLVRAGGPISLALVEDSRRGLLYLGFIAVVLAVAARFLRVPAAWALSLAVWPIWFYWGEVAQDLSDPFLEFPWREYR